MSDRRTSDIAVHVERLIIEGFDIAAAEGRQLEAALEGALQDLYEHRPAGLDRSGDRLLASVPAPSIRVVEGHSASELGRQIARSLHTAIER
jgi:hypothetical protein